MRACIGIRTLRIISPTKSNGHGSLNSKNATEDLVTMGSSVEFRDDVTGQVRRVVLVYPDKADVTAGRISVLTPVGAALIGMSKNQSIDWETPARERRSLTVLSVQQPLPGL